MAQPEAAATLRRQPASGQPAGGQPAGSGPEQGERKVFRIPIPADVSTTQQFLRFAEVQIFGRVTNMPWDISRASRDILDPARHIGRVILFRVPLAALEANAAEPATPGARAEAAATYREIGPEDRSAIDAEIDRRYYEATGDKPGTKIRKGEPGKAAVWNSLMREVLADRRKLDQLPEVVRNLLGPANFTPEHYEILAQLGPALAQLSEPELRAFFTADPNGVAITPGDYAQLLRIARKILTLPPEARQDYLSRVNASTTSLSELESAIDRYGEFRAGREKQAEEHEAAARPLLGSQDVYTAYRNYEALKSNVGLARSLRGSGMDRASAEESLSVLEQALEEAETALLAALKQKNFDSIEAFEASIEAYRVAFRTQAVNLALDVIARYEHVLFEERRKLQAGGAATIARGIAGTKASEHFAEYHRQEQTAAQQLPGPDDDLSTSWVEPYEQAKAAAAAARKQGEAEVLSGSGQDPLVAERGIDLEKLAGLDAAGVQAYLASEIDDRSEKVAAARRDFTEDPDRVFSRPELVAATQTVLGVDPGTVYGRIISDYVADEASMHLLTQLGLAGLALLLAFLVPGGGWVAAAALIGQAGISTYQAYAAYEEYQQQERDWELGFLSEEPSLFWVGVAIAGAALDIGIGATEVVRQSATALKALKGPLLEFSERDGDLAKLLAKIDAAEGLQPKLAQALKREAEAPLAAKQAWHEFAGATGRMSGLLPGTVDPGTVRLLGRALYRSIRQGATTIARLATEARFLEITGDLARMTGAERAELEAAFDEVKQLVRTGEARGMDEQSLLGFVDRWALNRGKPGFKLKLAEEMKAWKPLTTEQRRALSALETQKRTVTGLYQDKAEALEELLALRAQPTRTAEEVEQVRELEKRIRQLDPSALPDPRESRQLGRGQIYEAERTLEQREAEAARAQLTLYDRLRVTTPSAAARERTLRGVMADQVGPLRTPPGRLTVDHIVSVREITDMDGFADLLEADQKAILNDMRENLIAMDSAANGSKLDRTWRSWPQASDFYGPGTIEKMAGREAEVRALIEAEIKKRLARVPVRTP